MLRKWILAVWPWLIAIAVTVGTIVAVAYEQHSAREEYQAQSESECSALAISPEQKHACAKEAQSHKNYAPWWNVLMTWPEGVTVWAIIATGFVIAWQSNETRKSAIAAADAANAAYGSLTFAEAQWKLTKEKERARLEFNIENTDLAVEVAGEDLVHLIGTVSVKNIGASNAYIKRTSGTLITRLRNEALEKGEEYSSPLDISEKAIRPDKDPIPIKVYCFPTSTTRTFAENLEDGTFTLHLFGFIEYDTVGLGRRTEFEYEWKVIGRNDSLAGMLGLADSYPNSPRPARDRIAYGYWHPIKERGGEEEPIYSESDTYDQKPN
jgi:hypothetical protein